MKKISYFVMVLMSLSLFFLEAQEDTWQDVTCSISLTKTEIEFLEPLTLELKIRDKYEPRGRSFQLKIMVEKVVGEGEEAVKFGIAWDTSSINYWSEQGRMKQRLLVLYAFGEKKFLFDKTGTYKIKVNAGGFISNEVQIQVNSGILNLEQLDPSLKEKLLSQKFINLMYFPEEENGTGVQYAHELMAQYPQSALARYAKNAVALNNYSDFFNDDGTIEEGKSELLQHAGELKSVLKDNPVKGHYLTRLTKYNRGEALYYGDKLEKSRDLLNKLLKRPDDVRLKAVDQLKYVLHAIKTENPGSSPLDAKTLHEMMVIDSQQYLDSEVEEEEEGDED
jgi:hypothetical protein